MKKIPSAKPHRHNCASNLITSLLQQLNLFYEMKLLSSVQGLIKSANHNQDLALAYQIFIHSLRLDPTLLYHNSQQ